MQNFNGSRKCITSCAVILIAASAQLVLAAGSTAPADGASALTCQSGQTLFASGPLRAFKVEDDSGQQEVLVCTGFSAKPIVIDDPGPAIEVDADTFHLRGARLGFELGEYGLGAGGADTEVGWVDLKTGEVAVGLLNAAQGGSKGDPQLPEDVTSYAFAPDGTTAVIAGMACEVVAVYPVRAKPYDYGIYLLGPPLIVFTAHHGGLVHWSIGITATTVTWRTVNGTKRSAPWARGTTTTTSPKGGC